jgi:cysteine desulfuration protein SufE
VSDPVYPEKLRAIVALFEALPEEEKRQSLIAYADTAGRHQPKPGEVFVLEDVRKDEECADTVGVYLKADEKGRVSFRITLGPQVQTLTKAMTAILCKGLDGLAPEEVLAVPADFVPKIVGGQLVRIRSQTTYYVLGRMKAACKAWMTRRSGGQFSDGAAIR